MIRVPKTLEKSCDRYKDIWSNKNELRADQVSISNGTKYFFNCPDCSHSYEQSPATKTRGIGCPFCSKFNRKLCGDIKCSFCLPKSCDKYKNTWSSKNDKKSQEVALHSHVKFWFDCINCGHDYEQRPNDKKSGSECPYCYNKKLCGNITCESCLIKSCNIYSSIWSQKNDKTPEQVFLNCNKKFFFSCRKCNHDYQQKPNHKTNNIGCPYCSNRNLCGDIICSFCLPKSCYIYKNIWSSKNDESPEKVSISNNKKYFFNCLDCSHIYEQKPQNKTNNGNGCPYCVNKTEKKVADYLKEIDVKFKKEFRIDSKKRYDFYLPDFNLIIEIDGNQHFKQISNWQSCEYTIENDIKKMQTGIENGYSFLRIYQPDIWKEKIDWKKYIKANLYLRKTPTVCYQSSIVGIYEKHLKIYRSVV